MTSTAQRAGPSRANGRSISASLAHMVPLTWHHARDGRGASVGLIGDARAGVVTPTVALAFAEPKTRLPPAVTDAGLAETVSRYPRLCSRAWSSWGAQDRRAIWS
jgi:hypothetical protein